MTRWNTWSTALGFLAWLVGLLASLSNATLFDQIELLILFGMAVVAPLALSLVAPEGSRQATVYAVAVRFQPFAAILAGISLLLPIGWAAGLLASGWLVLTALMALFGLLRLRLRRNLPEVCISAGLVYASVSGIWLVIHQIWGSFLQFDRLIVLLTAAHFCFISFGALVIAGMAGRQLTRAYGLYRISAVGTIASPLVVAAGITLTAFTGSVSVVEVIGVVALAGSVLLLSAIILFAVRPGIQNALARWLITASASSLFVTMGLALAYSIGRSTGLWAVAIADMAQWHGWINAVGFAFLGLLGWRIALRGKNKSPG